MSLSKKPFVKNCEKKTSWKNYIPYYQQEGIFFHFFIFFPCKHQFMLKSMEKGFFLSTSSHIFSSIFFHQTCPEERSFYVIYLLSVFYLARTKTSKNWRRIKVSC